MKNINIYQSRGYRTITEEERKEQLENFIDSFGEEPESEEVLENYIHEYYDDYFDDEMTNIKFFEEKNGMKHYVIIGTVHTWRGDRGVVKLVEGMREVFQACMSGEEDVQAYYKNHQLRIDGVNHDSDCSGDFFRIRELTDDGYQYYDDHLYDMDEYKLLERLFNSSRYSRMVQLFPEMYGC